jgi:hypothetical protein
MEVLIDIREIGKNKRVEDLSRPCFSVHAFLHVIDPEVDRQEEIFVAEGPSMDQQPNLVGVGDQAGRRQELPGAIAWDDQVLVRADPLGVRRDLGQPARLYQVGIGAQVVVHNEVVGLAAIVDKLDQGEMSHLPQLRLNQLGMSSSGPTISDSAQGPGYLGRQF